MHEELRVEFDSRIDDVHERCAATAEDARLFAESELEAAAELDRFRSEFAAAGRRWLGAVRRTGRAAAARDFRGQVARFAAETMGWTPTAPVGMGRRLTPDRWVSCAVRLADLAERDVVVMARLERADDFADYGES